MAQQAILRGFNLQMGRHPRNFIDITKKTYGALFIYAMGGCYCGNRYWKTRCLHCGHEHDLTKQDAMKGRCRNRSCLATTTPTTKVA